MLTLGNKEIDRDPILLPDRTNERLQTSDFRFQTSDFRFQIPDFLQINTPKIFPQYLFHDAAPVHPSACNRIGSSDEVALLMTMAITILATQPFRTCLDDDVSFAARTKSWPMHNYSLLVVVLFITVVLLGNLQLSTSYLNKSRSSNQRNNIIRSSINIMTSRDQKRMKTTTTSSSSNEVVHCKEESLSPEDELASSKELELTYVEFYAGLGGWTMALEDAVGRLCQEQQKQDGEETPFLLRLRRLAAFDHSDICRSVFEYNFGDHNGKRKGGKKCCNSMPIERLTLKEMESWNSMIYVMSPPCQPHTRQHSNQQEDINDPRSTSFLHLVDLLSKMKQATLPKLIILENVVGFESSASCTKWREMLSLRNYHVGHFHLTPTQVHVPNDRPRYYCIAILQQQAENNDDDSGKKDAKTNVSLLDEIPSLYSYLRSENQVNSTSPILQTSVEELGITNKASSDQTTDQMMKPISSFLDQDQDSKLRESLQIPDKVINSSASWCFDIVTPNDSRSACFTSSYGKFIKGTGSILYEYDNGDHDSSSGNNEEQSPKTNPITFLLPPEERSYQSDWAKDINGKKLRYFSGTELARLFGFTTTSSSTLTTTSTTAATTTNLSQKTKFSFPPNTTVKQQWKLIGNSLNVQLSSKLVELGLRILLQRRA